MIDTALILICFFFSQNILQCFGLPFFLIFSHSVFLRSLSRLFNYSTLPVANSFLSIKTQKII